MNDCKIAMADSLSSSPAVASAVSEASKLSAASAAASDAIANKRFLGRTITVYEMLGSGTGTACSNPPVLDTVVLQSSYAVSIG